MKIPRAGRNRRGLSQRFEGAMTVKHYTLEQAIAKFWSRVDKSGGETACWTWTGAKSAGKGYGFASWNGKNRLAHRLSYELANGSFDGDLQVLHSCDNRSCVNPRHLSLGTHQDNMDDRNQKGRNRPVRGEYHYLHKLTDDEIDTLRAKYKNGIADQAQLATEYGISQSQVSRLINQRRRAKSA